MPVLEASVEIPDWLTGKLPGAVLDEIEASADPGAALRAHLDARFSSYEGGDRAPSPPMWILRALEWCDSIARSRA